MEVRVLVDTFPYAALLALGFPIAFFFKTTGCDLFAAAFLAAHRFFSAATIAALPTALSLRLPFEAAAAGVVAAFAPAHLFRCPAAVRLRAAALICRRAPLCGAAA